MTGLIIFLLFSPWSCLFMFVVVQLFYWTFSVGFLFSTVLLLFFIYFCLLFCTLLFICSFILIIPILFVPCVIVCWILPVLLLLLPLGMHLFIPLTFAPFLVMFIGFYVQFLDIFIGFSKVNSKKKRMKTKLKISSEKQETKDKTVLKEKIDANNAFSKDIVSGIKMGAAIFERGLSNFIVEMRQDENFENQDTE